MKLQIYQQKGKHVTLDLAGLWEGQPPCVYISATVLHTERLYPLGVLNCSALRVRG